MIPGAIKGEITPEMGGDEELKLSLAGDGRAAPQAKVLPNVEQVKE